MMRSAIGLFAALAVALTVMATISAATPHPDAAQETATIAVGDLWFCDASFQNGVCETTINAGDTVVWDFSGATAPHTTTDCGDSCDAPSGSPFWNSGTVSDGSTFQFTFNEPGTYSYLCAIHPVPMRGQITVLAAQEEPAATPGANPPPDDSLPALTVVAPPVTGQGIQAGAADTTWIIIALAASGVALAGLGAATLRRAPR